MGVVQWDLGGACRAASESRVTLAEPFPSLPSCLAGQEQVAEKVSVMPGKVDILQDES